MNILFKRFFSRFFWSTIALIFVLVLGTIGYKHISTTEISYVDGLYMTFITITSMGFSEVATGTNARLFTVLIGFMGIGVATFMISNFTALIIEGELKETYYKRKINKMIQSMERHYIICGIGRVGYHIVQELHRTGRPFVVIDEDEEKLKKYSNEFPEFPYITGNANSEEVLLKAGIKNAKGVFAATGDDNDNLVISLTAKYIKQEVLVIARCVNAVNNRKIKRAGADVVVNDNYIAGMRMASEMIRPTVVSFLDKMLYDTDKNLRVEEVLLTKKSADKSVKEIFGGKYPATLVLAIIQNDNWYYNPKGDTILSEGDKLIIITSPLERAELKAEL